MSQLGRRVLLVPSRGEARDAATLPRGTGRPHEEDLAENISRVWGDQPRRVGGAAEVAVGKGAALVAYDRTWEPLSTLRLEAAEVALAAGRLRKPCGDIAGRFRCPSVLQRWWPGAEGWLKGRLLTCFLFRGTVPGPAILAATRSPGYPCPTGGRMSQPDHRTRAPGSGAENVLAF